MYDTLTQNYNTAFAQQQNITSALTSMFQPILAAGPTQAGYSQAQSDALNTAAGEKVATDYAQAQRATQNILASRGGGDTFLPDSISANITASTANDAARARAAAQNSITQANYAQGYQNWNTAASVLGSTAGLLNPNTYASTATGAGQAASSTAQAMAAQSNSIWNSAIGALGGITGAALGNPSGILSMFGKSGTAVPYSFNPTLTTVPSTLTSGIPYIPSVGSVPYAAAGQYLGG